MSDKVYFVYVNQFGKFWPQKWYGSLVNLNTGKPVAEGLLAYSKLLTEQERNLTLDELASKYPYEGNKKNEAIWS